MKILRRKTLAFKDWDPMTGYQWAVPFDNHFGESNTPMILSEEATMTLMQKVNKAVPPERWGEVELLDVELKVIERDDS